jgi:hypothetical protein
MIKMKNIFSSRARPASAGLAVRFGVLFPSIPCYSKELRGNRAKTPAKASENYFCYFIIYEI